MLVNENKEGQRIAISTRFYWFKFLTIPFIILFLVLYIRNLDNYFYLGLLLFSIVAYFQFARSRRIYFDEENVYIVKFTSETVIPFVNIISINRSKTRLNGRRFWILKYQTKLDDTKEIRYFQSFNLNRFHKAVEHVNPKVEIWIHPFLKKKKT